MALQLRVVVVLAAAILTAAVHHRFLNQQLQTAEFVVINQPLKSGQQITKNHVARVELGGDLRVLNKSLLPWGSVGALYGSRTYRNYHGGELVLLRAAEERADTPYQRQENEFVFTVTIRDMNGFKDSSRIGQPVGFLLTQRAPDSNELAYEKCGPFTLRQLGGLSMPIDAESTKKFRTRTVRLSLPETPGRDVPAAAEKLLDAVNGKGGYSLASFYTP